MAHEKFFEQIIGADLFEELSAAAEGLSGQAERLQHTIAFFTSDQKA